MSITAGSWEHQLMDWAYEGIKSPPSEGCPKAHDEILQRAYGACNAVTKEHSRTFHLASGLLPPAKRDAARALYAFCRVSDDIVDRANGSGPEKTLAQLNAWRELALDGCEPDDDPVALAWSDTQAAYNIPRRYAEQLLDGIARDLTRTRYETFQELTAYCYGVASTVGLMAMHIIGFAGPDAIPYAVKLGVALQLTNILRDIAEDWAAGRLYLPLEELSAFGLSEQDVAKGEVNDRWISFMAFQIQRVRHLYAASLPGVDMLHSDGRFAIRAAAELYRGILDDIEAHDMDVFHRRAYVSQGKKLRQLPGIWWRARTGG
ncbi:MAG: phytoene/squalene synthase family protein [Anaerolineae bacterium]